MRLYLTTLLDDVQKLPFRHVPQTSLQIQFSLLSRSAKCVSLPNLLHIPFSQASRSLYFFATRLDSPDYLGHTRPSQPNLGQGSLFHFPLTQQPSLRPFEKDGRNRQHGSSSGGDSPSHAGPSLSRPFDYFPVRILESFESFAFPPEVRARIRSGILPTFATAVKRWRNPRSLRGHGRGRDGGSCHRKQD